MRYEAAGDEQKMPFMSDVPAEFWLLLVLLQTACLVKMAARPSKVFLALSPLELVHSLLCCFQIESRGV